ncbi:MAG: WYL domain-containing protein [Bacteroidetes bacterium]|nr:WYL domain-containing protein [Bacteroidota bacterium]
MSKREYILRYLTIIKFLRNRGEVTFEQLSDYLKSESEFHGYTLSISKRTFQRDVDEIRALFNIDIQFSHARSHYFIAADEEQAALSNKMLEAFDLFNTLNTAGKLAQHIIFETRKPQGMEHFYGLLHAIKNRFVIRFSYQKFWEEEATHRAAEPLSLKEFKSRWYILAKDQKDNKVKTFGLDRISELEITKKMFTAANDFNASEMFKNCFGIIAPDDSKPEEIILSFDATQGKYIKSFPLHESQQIVEDNSNEVRIKLKLYITHDFLMELLSYGDALKIIWPLKLKNRICKMYSKALEQYSVRA